MTSLKKFVRTMDQQRATAGKVVASSANTISVATKNGIVVVTKDRASLYGVGDSVRVSDGAIIGKIVEVGESGRYYV